MIIGFLAQVKDEAIVFLDAEGRVVGWTGGAEHVLGYAEAEVLGMSIARIFTEEDRAKGLHDFELQVARTSVRSEDDRWHVRKDGTAVKMHFRGLRDFTWAGYRVHISIPGLDHLDINDMDIGAVDEEFLDRQGGWDMKKLGAFLADKMNK